MFLSIYVIEYTITRYAFIVVSSNNVDGCCRDDIES